MENGKQYWRSLNQLDDTPEFREWLHREFPEGASELTDSGSRRTLLKLMAASFGLAGLTACRRPVEKILPNARGVEDYIPGNPYFYNTILTYKGVATGVTVESHEFRPTKIEGNAKHPSSLGAASAISQASILSLYDPDRSKDVWNAGRKADWNAFLAAAKAQFDKAGDGAALRILSERSASPSLAALKAHTLAKYPKAKWVEYEPLASDAFVAGAQIAFGQPLQPQYNFEKADVIVAFDCDFLGIDNESLSHIKHFSKRRRVENEKDEMNRLYAVESQFSITGAMADHRLRMRSADVAAFAGELNNALGALNVLQGGGDKTRKWIAAIAKDLNAHKGKSLVIAGPRQPAHVHALAMLINNALGNVGETVTFTRPLFDSPPNAIAELAGEMGRGQISTLVILGGNPVFNAPADLSFGENLKKVEFSVHLGLEADETAKSAKWHVPAAHSLEAWGDGRALDGTVSIQQPLIAPLFNGKSDIELIAALTGYKDQRGYDIVRNLWTAQLPEKLWRTALHDGIVANSAFPAVKPPTADAKRVLAAVPVQKPGAGIEAIFVQDASLYDGRFANNAWMQEAPDPMTKLVWDNAALISPATAKSLGVEEGDMLAIESNGRSIEVPAYIVPGHADQSITLPVGYGRKEVGRVGQGAGHNVYPLRSSAEAFIAPAVNVRKMGRHYTLVTTQEHHSMEGRPLVREATLEHYKHEPNFTAEASEVPALFSLFKEHSYENGNQWGMAIDLNTCVGCNACVTACQAENNIPVVGKDQVRRGREMHWIRLDRYYTGSPDEAQAVLQPVGCQHCENAPCETVCPVAATVHSPEGLNDMAYNRCVGTRYCANNCPYKVRRFNYLNWHSDTQESEKLAYNPDVSVRMRGVMEKCTYCVQRIQEVKIAAKADGRRAIKDGEILTACQQTCPADAIVFGNINDPNSRVSKAKAQNRNYAMLAELNIKPRTSFLAKLRNANPELA